MSGVNEKKPPIKQAATNAPDSPNAPDFPNEPGIMRAAGQLPEPTEEELKKAEQAGKPQRHPTQWTHMARQLLAADYFRELKRLFRERHDNPVAHYAAPWRRSRTTLVLLICLAALLFLGVVFLTAGPWQDASYYGEFGTALFVVTGLLIPAIFLIFGPNWRSPDWLADVELTLLKRREVAFGVGVWPVRLSAYVILIGAIMFIVHFPWDRAYGAARDFSLGMGLYLFFSIALTLKCLQVWLRASKAPWSIVYVAPLLTAYEFLKLLLATVLLAVLYDDILNWDSQLISDDAFAIGAGYVVGICLLIAAVRSAGRHAGEAWFARLLPWEWQRVDMGAREWAAIRLPKSLRPGRVEFNRLWRQGFVSDIRLNAVALGICCTVGFLGCSSDKKEDLFPFAAFLSAAMISLSLTLWRRAREHGGALPVESGGVSRAIIFYMLPTFALFTPAVVGYVIYMILLNEHGSAMELAFGCLMMSLAAIAIGAVTGAWIVYLLLPRHQRRLGLSIVWSLAAFILIFSVLPLAHKEEQIIYNVAFTVAAVLLSLESVLHRAFDEETRDVQVGRLNTDESARNPIEIIPSIAPCSLFSTATPGAAAAEAQGADTIAPSAAKAASSEINREAVS